MGKQDSGSGVTHNLQMKPAILLRFRWFVISAPIACKVALISALAGCSNVSEQAPLAAGDHYAEVDDIRMHYKVDGSGPPLLLIHGGFGSTALWDRHVGQLAKSFTVIRPDSRGRGRSTDSDAPITYGRMASDMTRLLDKLGLRSVLIAGHSEGGIVALHLLHDYPDRVRGAVLFGTLFNISQYRPDSHAELEELAAALRRGDDSREAVRWFRQAYQSLSPQPTRFPVVMQKLADTWWTEPTFSAAELGTINRPVRIVKVDRDEYVSPEEFDELARAIPGSDVYEIKNATHRVLAEHPDRSIDAIHSFATALQSRH